MSSFKARQLTLSGNAVTVVRSATYTTNQLDGSPQGTGTDNAITIANYNDSLRSLTPYVIVVIPAGGAQSGTLQTINGLAEGDIVVVMTQTTKTINIVHGVGNLFLAEGGTVGTVSINGRAQSLTLYHNGFELVEWHRAFPPVL